MAPPPPSPPVKRLTLSLTIGQVSADLPWDLFPDPMQRRLDKLDNNDDGEINPSEVRFGEKSFSDLYRLIWGFTGSSPHNDRYKDRASLPDRTKAVEEIQYQIYKNGVATLLNSPKAEDYQEALKILQTTGDFSHLDAAGVQAWGDYVRSRNVEFVYAAEALWIEALRFASEVRDGYAYIPKLQKELKEAREVLDTHEEAQFLRALFRPYLIAGSQSPITADVTSLEKDGVVTFAVAVPQRYVKAVEKRGEDVENSLKKYFNSTEQVWAKSSKSFLLVAEKVEQDLPGSKDDPITEASSYHLDQKRLSRTIFKDHHIVYYRVEFRMPGARQALGTKRVAKLDLSLEMAGDNGSIRKIPGSFVLQDLLEGPSTTLLMSDTHVMEREWEVKPVMAASLLQTAEDGEEDLSAKAEEVERFYRPNNELVLGLLETSNHSYRGGEVDRILVTGDLIDNVNDPITMKFLPYRQTNVATAAWILGHAEAPLYVTTGNHDHVGPSKPKSINPANFVFRSDLRKLFAEHYDEYRYRGSLLWNALKRIATRPCAKDDDACFIYHTFQETNSDGLHGTPADAFLAHQLRNSPYETFAFSIGHGFRLFAWPTEDEHLNYSYWLMEEAQDPVRKDIMKRGIQYLKNIAPFGKGPQPHNFVAWLEELKAAESQKWKLLPSGHYPVFAIDSDNHHELDNMSPITAWAVRQVAYYYRFQGGESPMPLFIAGHQHRYEAVVFDFDFSALAKLFHTERHLHGDYTDAQLKQHLEVEAEDLKEKYLAELKEILEKADPDSIYEKLEDLRRQWHLDDILIIKRAGDPGKNGFPDPLVEEFNRDSKAFTKKHGTLFLTLPAAGPPTPTHTGSMLLTTKPGGELQLDFRFHRIGHDLSFIETQGKNLDKFREDAWQEAQVWDPSQTLDLLEVFPKKTQVIKIGPRGFRQDPQWEALPLVYQYAKRKIGFNVNLETTYGYREGDFASGLSLGGELRIPTTNKAHLNFGGPNYLAFGGRYNFLTKETGGFLGIDMGLLRADGTADRSAAGDWFFGCRALLHSVLPGEPGIGVSLTANRDGDWRALVHLNFSLTFFTRKPKDRFDP